MNTPNDLVERVARAMRDVYLSRQPKWSGEGYPLEEFTPEARAALAIALEEAAKVAEIYEYDELEDDGGATIKPSAAIRIK